MEDIKYFQNIAIAHEDDRRIIYDPNVVPSHVRGKHFLHNIIFIKDSQTYLGNHKHSQDMLYFSPSGDLVISFALAGKSKLYELKRGSMVFIPRDVYSTVRGKTGSMIYGFGSRPYEESRTEASDLETKKLLESLIDAHWESMENAQSVPTIAA